MYGAIKNHLEQELEEIKAARVASIAQYSSLGGSFI